MKREWRYLDARVRQLVDEARPAPRGSHFLVVATNSEGRPCGWGKASEFTDAVEVADRAWDAHGHGDGCYPGETRGAYEVHLVSDAPVGSAG